MKTDLSFSDFTTGLTDLFLPRRCLLMRFRYNVLDLAKRGGFYDELVGKVFASGGAWDLEKSKAII